MWVDVVRIDQADVAVKMDEIGGRKQDNACEVVSNGPGFSEASASA